MCEYCLTVVVVVDNSERYRDLIEAADTITAMKQSADSVWRVFKINFWCLHLYWFVRYLLNKWVSWYHMTWLAWKLEMWHTVVDINTYVLFSCYLRLDQVPRKTTLGVNWNEAGFCAISVTIQPGQSNEMNTVLMPPRKISHWTLLFLGSAWKVWRRFLYTGWYQTTTMFVVSIFLLAVIDRICLKTVNLYKNKKNWSAYLPIHFPSYASGLASSDHCAHL